MRRKVNNSEIHEIKRYYEVPSEKVQEWSNTIEELAKQRDQYKTERDTLIDDLKVLRAKNEELELENEFLEIKLGGAEVYNDAIKTYYPMYESLRKQHTTLTDHIRLKVSANPGEHRYIALVNFIDRLEKGEN